MRPKVLTVFFSRTGTTRVLAEAIARATHGDLEELRELRSRRGVLGWLRSGYEGTYGKAAEPLTLRHELGGYDIVFIGSPTWNQAVSSPVRGFMQRSQAGLANVALFATCAGRGADRVLAQMGELLPEPPLATLGMLESDVRHGGRPGRRARRSDARGVESQAGDPGAHHRHSRMSRREAAGMNPPGRPAPRVTEGPLKPEEYLLNA
jgi:flavodoxin